MHSTLHRETLEIEPLRFLHEWEILNALKFLTTERRHHVANPGVLLRNRDPRVPLPTMSLWSQGGICQEGTGHRSQSTEWGRRQAQKDTFWAVSKKLQWLPAKSRSGWPWTQQSTLCTSYISVVTKDLAGGGGGFKAQVNRHQRNRGAGGPSPARGEAGRTALGDSQGKLCVWANGQHPASPGLWPSLRKYWVLLTHSACVLEENLPLPRDRHGGGAAAVPALGTPCEQSGAAPTWLSRGML